MKEAAEKRLNRHTQWLRVWFLIRRIRSNYAIKQAAG